MSARERRVVVGGGIVLLATVIVMRVIPAWWEWVTDSRAVAVVSIAELARTHLGIAGLPLLRDSLVARNERYLALAPSILAGSSAGNVSATLASMVSGAASEAGLELGAMSIRPDTAGATVFSRPLVRGDARGDVAGLTRFLAALERGPTTLVIRQLSVTQPEPAAGSDRPETLRIEFTIEAIALERVATEPPALDQPRESPRAPRAPGDSR